MRQRIFQSTLAFLLLMPGALAQTGDWQSVMDLQPGTSISVKAGHFFAHNLCTLQSVNDETLVCERIQHGPGAFRVSPVHVFRYNRKIVREVRLEHSDEANTALGAAVGAGAGVAIGASLSPQRTGYSRGGGALLLGTIGGLMGGVFARDFPIVHGRVVYKP
jgi:hypothetical protein